MSDLTEWLRHASPDRTSRFHEKMKMAADEIDKLSSTLEEVKKCTKDRPLDGGSNQWENGWDAAMRRILLCVAKEAKE